MAALKNPRHELLAQAVACGKTLEQAYVAAGFGKGEQQPKSIRRYAHRVRHRPEVDQRIQEIQADALRVNRDSLTAEVNAALIAAADNHTAKATMLTLKGRLHGLLVDNVSVNDATRYPLEKLLSDLIAAGLPEEVARRKLGYFGGSTTETAKVIQLKR